MGCGTFFGLTRDPAKRACYLEKRVSKSSEKCAKGRQRHCAKTDKFSAELATIHGSHEQQSLDLSQDEAMRIAQMQHDIAVQSRRKQAAEAWLVPAAGVFALFLLGVAVVMTDEDAQEALGLT